jgi:hypothetical protein
VDALCEHNAIDTLLSNFILPLQDDQISTVDPATNKVGRLSASWQCHRLLWLLSSRRLPKLKVILTAQARVHCSLNINTETGRLSARRPNLQNQPALEKDRYRVS